MKIFLYLLVYIYHKVKIYLMVIILNLRKDKYFSLFVIISLLFIITLIIILKFYNTNTFYINVNNETKEVITLKNLNLIPGEKFEYDLNLKSKKNGKYGINISFNEIEESLLKDYLKVVIFNKEEILYDDLLCNLIRDNGIDIELDFYKNRIINLKISYYLDESVGNEVQKEIAMFELIINVKLLEEWNEKIKTSIKNF